MAEGIANAEKYFVEISGAIRIETADKKKTHIKKTIDFFVLCEPIPTPKIIFPIENKINSQPSPIIK